jgi:REP element-mobilizing transposase RayT
MINKKTVWLYIELLILQKMAQSLSRLYVHLIFHIKNTSVKIRKTEKQRVYAYMGTVIKSNGSLPIVINGTDDHVHVLCVMSKNIALSKLAEEIKRHSSRWIKTIDDYYQRFAWQGGYAGFSVSPSIHAKTRQYIEDQEGHHRKMTFKEEYLLFLKEYGIEYNEKYLWTD